MKNKLFSLLLVAPLLSGCLGIRVEFHFRENAYAVYLGATEEDIDKFGKYEEIVIDAQYFSKESIQKLKDSGATHVISYLNIGSIESFRPYYEQYKHLTLGEYEHWEEERWVDVSKKEWQDFIVNDLVDQLLEKGVNGFFIDNVDVYYNYHTEEIYDGLEKILTDLRLKFLYTIINGGDTFVYEHFEKAQDLRDICGAINQETVFSKINWEDGTFSRNDKEEMEYFKNYVLFAKDHYVHGFILEYTTDEQLIKEVKDFCAQNVLDAYFSSNLELIPE